MNKEAICKEVIITTLAVRGNGTEENPIRCITQIWDKDGTLIAERDSFDETFTAMDLIHFSRWIKSKEWDAELIDEDVVNIWLKEIR